jgi:ribonuclease HI
MATTQFNYHILFDGGSHRNGSAVQEAYGSYIIHTARGRQRLTRCTFGHNTNNQAEYKALIAALEDLVTTITDACRDPADFSVRVVGDSQLVLNQITGKWKVKSLALRRLHTHAMDLLSQFGEFVTEHAPRETCVRLLGH